MKTAYNTDIRKLYFLLVSVCDEPAYYHQPIFFIFTVKQRCYILNWTLGKASLIQAQGIPGLIPEYWQRIYTTSAVANIKWR